MLLITPIQDEKYHIELAKRCGFTAVPFSLAYLAANADEKTHEIISEIGICEFTIHNDEGTITALASLPDVSDDEALMIMARTAMSFINRCGIKNAHFAQGAAKHDMMKSLGFRCGDNNVFSIDLDEFYKSPCRYNAENGEKK